jgi:hypothetical protein
MKIHTAMMPNTSMYITCIYKQWEFEGIPRRVGIRRKSTATDRIGLNVKVRGTTIHCRSGLDDRTAPALTLLGTFNELKFFT